MEKRVYLYVLDTMADWENGYICAELNSGRFFKKVVQPFRVVTVGADRAEVRTMGGVRIIPDLTVEDCRNEMEHAAALILPGGDTWLEPVHKPILSAAKEFLSHSITVGAICGATVGLAADGLLDHIPHTSSSLDYLKQVCPEYKGEAYYRPEPAVASGGLITAYGVAPLEFAHLVFKELDVFSESTLEAWYQLNITKSDEWFYKLMASVN